MFKSYAFFVSILSIAILGCGPAPEEAPEEPEQEEAQQQETILPDLAGASVESLKDDLAASVEETESQEGWEPGNLAEFGVAELLTESDWERAVEASKTAPVLIFKHSTQCSISGGAYRRLGKYLEESSEQAPKTFLVKVIERRPVSQKIEKDVAVVHESPQALLLENGKAIWNTSHHDITEESIRKALESVSADENV